MVNHPGRSKRHSPGPWTIGKNGQYIIAPPTADFPHGQPVASVLAGPGKNTTGNAILIAAAPTLLAFLRRICNEVETPEDLISAIAEAETFIAKIEA
jgi:hypothetical protein